MVAVGSSVDGAVVQARRAGEGAKLVRVWLPRPTYFVCAAEENPADIPVLRARRGTRAEVIAVVGADGHVRPDSVRDVPVEAAP